MNYESTIIFMILILGVIFLITLFFIDFFFRRPKSWRLHTKEPEDLKQIILDSINSTKSNLYISFGDSPNEVWDEDVEEALNKAKRDDNVNIVIVTGGCGNDLDRISELDKNNIIRHIKIKRQPDKTFFLIDNNFSIIEDSTYGETTRHNKKGNGKVGFKKAYTLYKNNYYVINKFKRYFRDLTSYGGR